MFGKYKCSCGNKWASGNSWTGMGQECKNCKEYVYPYSLKPLCSSPDQYQRKPHLEELCGMCQRLGRNCKTLPSVNDEDIADDDDLESILTENSSIFSDDSLTPPTSGEVTPTDNDEGDVADAVIQLQQMNIQNWADVHATCVLCRLREIIFFIAPSIINDIRQYMDIILTTNWSQKGTTHDGIYKSTYKCGLYLLQLCTYLVVHTLWGAQDIHWLLVLYQEGVNLVITETAHMCSHHA